MPAHLREWHVDSVHFQLNSCPECGLGGCFLGHSVPLHQLPKAKEVHHLPQVT